MIQKTVNYGIVLPGFLCPSALNISKKKNIWLGCNISYWLSFHKFQNSSWCCLLPYMFSELKLPNVILVDSLRVFLKKNIAWSFSAVNLYKLYKIRMGTCCKDNIVQQWIKWPRSCWNWTLQRRGGQDNEPSKERGSQIKHLCNNSIVKLLDKNATCSVC